MAMDKGIEHKLTNDMLTFAVSKHDAQVTGMGAASKELHEIALSIFHAPASMMTMDTVKNAAILGSLTALSGDALTTGLGIAAGAAIGAINSVTKPSKKR